MRSEQTGLIQLPGLTLGILHRTPDVETHRFTYDKNGQKETYKDPRGRITTYGYDNRNRLETTREPKREDQTEHPETRIEYDSPGTRRRSLSPIRRRSAGLTTILLAKPGRFSMSMNARPTWTTVGGR